LATPVTLAYAPIDPSAKLDCVAYAPFRGKQTPRAPGLITSPEQIAEDLAELAKISQCVRTYSVDNGLDKVPELAAKVGLKVLLGVWIGSNRLKNALLIDNAISLAKEYPGVITAIVVGNEVLLRGEMTASDLREIIRSVKTRVNIPVSYADVWEFWLRNREVSGEVDFVTVHMLPYWEDVPVGAEDAAAHVDAIRKSMAMTFPGKEILIGETGWPSKGRMRDGALPSRINQARFYSGILDRAKQENFRVILFEAYDEPWKRQWEGTVGGYWGLFDGKHRTMKYPPGAAVSNFPFWKLQLGCGLALSISVFGVALLTLRRRSLPPRSISWVAVAVSATVGGILLGVSADNMLYQSYGLAGWLGRGLLLAAGIAAPLLSSNALMSGRALPTFLELIGPRESRTRSFPTMVLGFTLAATTLIAAETALSLVFDPRWRDFPFAGLTMAVVPFWTLTLLNRPKSGTRPVAEAVFAGLFAVAALYITSNEGPHNWQALWTSAAYFLLGATLWQARCAAVEATTATMPVVLSEVGLLDTEGGGVSPDLISLEPRRQHRSPEQPRGFAATSNLVRP
jgi:glucan 1,3-beta-glucosidase